MTSGRDSQQLCHFLILCGRKFNFRWENRALGFEGPFAPTIQDFNTGTVSAVTPVATHAALQARHSVLERTMRFNLPTSMEKRPSNPSSRTASGKRKLVKSHSSLLFYHHSSIDEPELQHPPEFIGAFHHENFVFFVMCEHYSYAGSNNFFGVGKPRSQACHLGGLSPMRVPVLTCTTVRLCTEDNENSNFSDNSDFEIFAMRRNVFDTLILVEIQL